MDSKLIEMAVSVVAAWEARDLSVAPRLLADDFTLSGPAPEALNRDAYLGFQAIHNAAFADWRFNIAQIVVDGDKLRITFQISATHTGAYDVSKLGVPIPAVEATGKSRRWPVEHMTFSFRDGKISNLHVVNSAEGGVIGTLEWLGIKVPAPAL